jgi:hypothetical protein
VALCFECDGVGHGQELEGGWMKVKIEFEMITELEELVEGNTYRARRGAISSISALGMRL